MKTKNKSAVRRFHYTAAVMLVGLLLLCFVFAVSTASDMDSVESHLSDTVNYIKKQCASYSSLNLASETKSLLRVMESTQQVERSVRMHGEPDTDMLQKYADDLYLSGVMILDADGTVREAYHDGTAETDGIKEIIERKTVLDTAEHPLKTYAARMDCSDGSYIDFAACGRADGEGVIAAYYHTPKEYAESYSLSFQNLLSGYSIERDGTIAVTQGDLVVASNDSSLEGKHTEEIATLKNIRERTVGDALVHVPATFDGVGYSFGMIDRGRDYYVYAYVPERNVFESTPRKLLFALIGYSVAMILLILVRWKMASGYREDQLQMQKEYTERLQAQNRELKEARDNADRANAAKTSFLSRMSHDIRTPLNGIIGLLKIDEAHPDDLDLLRTNHKKMTVAADHLLSLINDILQMSKLEDGEIVLTHERMNLDQLSHDILTIIEQRAAEAGVTLEYDRTSERILHPYVYGSPLHVRQIFLNVYGNCIKYNKVGGRVETHVTCVESKDGTVTYAWRIEDTGIGMSEDFLKHIFEPFAQERVDARSVYNGTGLGMSIVKSLIDKMGGTIDVTSEIGKGSVFYITLPFEIAEAQEAEEPAAKEEEAGSIRGLRLLIAEDNELNAEIAKTLLEDEGALTDIVYDGGQAVEAFRNNPPGTYDAILMDMMMPHTDGISATKAIRALERPDAKKIPIIAMTANAFAEDAKKCLAAGMDAHLAKPLQMDKVVAVVSKCCKKNETE